MEENESLELRLQHRIARAPLAHSYVPNDAVFGTGKDLHLDVAHPTRWGAHAADVPGIDRSEALFAANVTTSEATEGPALLGAERQIEFIGPPGVGKSAIFHASLARLGKQGIYRTPTEGRFLAAAACLPQLRSLRRFSYHAAFRLPRIGEIYARRLAVSSSEESFRETLRSHSVFLECCVEMALTGFGDAFTRFGRLSIMLEQLRDMHLWNRLPAAVRILQEDALIQKGWTCAPASREAFFSFVPKPGAVVLVVAPPDVIVERLRSRKRTISAHVGLSDTELYAATVDAAEAFQLAADVLGRRAVPVFEVNGEAQPLDVADSVAEFLRNRVRSEETS